MFRRKKKFSPERCIALAFFLLLGLLIAYSFFLSPFGMNEITSAGKLADPSLTHPFGTDHLARDLLTRVGQGAFRSLVLALAIVSIGAVGGLLLGAFAGYFGGLTDWLLSRLIDTLLAFPGILMALLVMTVFGRGPLQLTISLGIAFIPSFARIVRSSFQSYRGRNFVKRLEIMDTPVWRIIFLHITPLLKDQYLDAYVIGLANAILAEAGLSFLGFGVQAPNPSLGSILSDAQSYVFRVPRYALIPGLLLVLMVFAIHMVRRDLEKGGSLS